MSRQFGLMVTAAGLGTAAPAVRAQPCQPYWTQGQASAPSTQAVGLVSFDDGSGPALYGILGIFQHVYRWHDGDPGWTRVEEGMPSNYTESARLYTLDDGSGPRLFDLIGVNNGTSAMMVVWSGQSWEPAPPGLERGSQDWYVSGDIGEGQAIYSIRSGSSLSYAERWAGDHWVQLGPSISYLPAISIITTASGPHLYGIGNFPNVPHFTAMWDGGQWVPAGDADLALINDSITFDDGSGLAAYGWGTATIGGVAYQGLLKFDGEHWTVLGHFDPPGSLQVVRGGIMFDDGLGPAMFLRGDFHNMGGIPAERIARYGLLDHTWSTLGSGFDSGATGLAALPTRRGPSLFAIGSFTHAGGGLVNHTAQYVGCPNCYANCDLSTRAPALNVNDFICFMTKFIQQDPYANCTNDAAIDVGDFVCFMGRFAAGCP